MMENVAETREEATGRLHGHGHGHGHAPHSEREPSVKEEADECEVKQELSVIVHPHDDSPDSELLSPGKISPGGMIDATDFTPEPTYQTLTSVNVNGRMSPPGLSSYATLTPLQPLPPISTVSDKFAYGHTGNVSGSFTVMQNNGLGLGMTGSPYGMSPHHYSPNNVLVHSPLSPHSGYSQNGLNSPQKSVSPPGYDSPYNPVRTLSPPSHSPPQTFTPQAVVNGACLAVQHHTVVVSPGPQTQHGSPTPQTLIVATNSPPKPATHTLTLRSVSPVSAQQAAGELEEINTKELAQRISAELKRYSIPQAIFAQRVLCRSQGTLSDLLRNPKPWSKLKSGRETFRRMWKWLQEPEFQRMSALRLAGNHTRQYLLFISYPYTLSLTLVDCVL